MEMAIEVDAALGKTQRIDKLTGRDRNHDT
jgi:hypothetical protein